MTIGSFVDNSSSGNSPYAGGKVGFGLYKNIDAFSYMCEYVQMSCVEELYRLNRYAYYLDYDYSHFIYFTAAHLIEILLTQNFLHLQTSSKRPNSVDGGANRSCDLKDKVAGESRQTHMLQQFLQAP